ncbi:hypothetical protein [Thalassomonas haliotis]|uniref:Uncharacterized protein n=1 Tax=Thalassomonas haliotis TaxID=485448 RepID=A0ABY7VAZ0_9GAMM|nr:hypothetical protein [Thalassomonas haliotis]WDE10552.1 hypothetical protein H3N35_20140 [Thalassomonas haliotis]
MKTLLIVSLIFFAARGRALEKNHQDNHFIGDISSYAMGITEFERQLGYSSSRCATLIMQADGRGELNYALAQNAITLRAFDWGRVNNAFPVIERNNQIETVCSSLLIQASNGVVDKLTVAENRMFSGITLEQFLALDYLTRLSPLPYSYGKATLSDVLLDDLLLLQFVVWAWKVSTAGYYQTGYARGNMPG